jgi:hypothetical protein
MKIGNSNNIKILAPTFVENYTEEEMDKNIHKEYYKNNMGILGKYFFYNLHDSKILLLKNINNNMYLRINDIATFEFARALINKLNLEINIQKIIFPLEIISEETKHFSFNVVDLNGELHKHKLIKVSEYLHEEIIEWTNEDKEIAFDLWTGKITPCRILLLLSCKNIKVIENQKTYWEKYFGTKYDKYYNEFRKERNKGTFLSDYSICIKFIEKIMNE